MHISFAISQQSILASGLVDIQLDAVNPHTSKAAALNLAMQFTIDVLIFLLGFSIAVIVDLKLKHGWSSLEDVLKDLRSITNAGIARAPRRDKKAESQQRLLPLADAELLTKAQREQLPEESWQRQAYEEVKSILLVRAPGAKKFPCIYATAGYRHNEHRYIFMHSEDPTEPRNIRLLASAMRAYLPQSRFMGPNTSLVIVHPTSPHTKFSVETYQKKFWDTLRGLRICDLKAWPSEIPTETNAPKWAFCFDGVPWFPAAMTPAHEQRHSRHAPNFIIAMQPKWVFDNLFRTPEIRRAAVEAVRKLMPAFDEIELSPDLSAYGTEGTTEAHQYYLLDENKTSHCPFADLDR